MQSPCQLYKLTLDITTKRNLLLKSPLHRLHVLQITPAHGMCFHLLTCLVQYRIETTDPAQSANRTKTTLIAQGPQKSASIALEVVEECGDLRLACKSGVYHDLDLFLITIPSLQII